MNKQIIETEAHNLFELLICIVFEEQNREKVINQNTLRFNRTYRISLSQSLIFLF
jgi:endonuclease III